MEILTAFEKIDSIGLQADIKIVDKEKLLLTYTWEDAESDIVFAKSPADGRHFNLWQQTCFEAFVRPTGKNSYFEFNLSPKGAWNVYEFLDYRDPQPPKEFLKAEMTSFTLTANHLSAQFLLKDQDLRQLDVSLCAVLFLNDGGGTYWSSQHAKRQPDFHHPETFVIKRSY